MLRVPVATLLMMSAILFLGLTGCASNMGGIVDTDYIVGSSPTETVQNVPIQSTSAMNSEDHRVCLLGPTITK